MSSFPNVTPMSPQSKKNPLVAHGIFSPNSNLLARPASSKVHKQKNSPNFYAYKPNQPPPWGDNGDSKRRDISPIGHNSRDEKSFIAAQYNFNNIVLHRRDSVGHNNRSKLSRDVSPLGRMNMQNEGVDFPPRAIRIENRDHKQGERDNSWHKLMNRPQEQALMKNQKLFEWRRVLDDQLAERQVKKYHEEERKRIEDAEAEERYQRQIEELSNQIHQRKKILHKNGILRQQSNVYPLGNTSTIDEVDLTPAKTNAKSHKEIRDKRGHRENLSHMNSPIPMLTNVRERRGKSNNKEESSRHMDYSAEKRDNRPQPQNDHLNYYIDNLKAEILHGQEVFKNHMKDLKEEAYKMGKFRNLAERNLLGAQRAGFVKGGVSKLYQNIGHKDMDELEEMMIPIMDPSSNKQKKIRIKVQEEKFKWDDDGDFFAKMPSVNKNKQMLLGVQMMVKIEPISEQLLAYKKPKSPQKKWFEENNKSPQNKEIENNKNRNKEKKQEKKDQSQGNDKLLKSGGGKKIDTDLTLAENKLKTQTLSPKKTVEDRKVSPNITNNFETIITPKHNDLMTKLDEIDAKTQKQNSQKESTRTPNIKTTPATPKKEEKVIQEDDLQISKNMQPLAMMLKQSNVSEGRDPTPSIGQDSKRNHTQPEESPAKAPQQQGPEVLQTDEDVSEKEIVKEKKSKSKRKESDVFEIKNRQLQSLNNIGLKSDVALKALSKFVSKDGLEAQIAGNKKLQADPLARLDYMIDYLFNYNP